jgi:drug/metabolite transporter (DMT)-like permease
MMKNTPAAKGTRLAYLLAVINAVVIGISFLAVKMTVNEASALDTLTFRFGAAFAILSIPAALGRMKLNYRGKPLQRLLLLAGLYPLCFFTLQAFGLQHATSAEGGIISAFTPVVTLAFAAVFLKEATSLLQKLFTLLSVCGVVFVFVMKGSTVSGANPAGVVLLLLSCSAFAGYSVLARSVTKHFTPVEISYFTVGAGFAVSLIISLAIHAPDGTLGSLAAPLADAGFLMPILYLGAVQTVTALLGSYILSRIEASKMAAFANLSTVVSIAAGASVLGEPVTWVHLGGSALIIAGVVGANLAARQRTPRTRGKPMPAEPVAASAPPQP